MASNISLLNEMAMQYRIQGLASTETHAGPCHMPHFTATVSANVNNQHFTGMGEGQTKKIAKELAATDIVSKVPL